MKKVVNYRQKISVNGSEFKDNSSFNCFRYIEVPEEEEIVINSFAAAVEIIERGEIRGASVEGTLFRNKPYLHFTFCDFDAFEMTVFPKNFKSIKMRKVYEESDGKLTLKQLAGTLPAEEFCEYLKDRGLTHVGPL